MYIDLDPLVGDASYIIGEGLNGGYTVEQWEEGWQHFWRTYLLFNLVAVIVTPDNGQEFLQGEPILWHAYYAGELIGIASVSWNEILTLDTSTWALGNHTLFTGYGTGKSVTVVVREKIPDDADKDPNKAGEGFNEKFVIKNSAFNNYNAMTEAEIQAFLDEKGEDNPNHISKREFSGHTAAYWIKKGADMAGINPGVLLAKIQSEQGLITGPRSVDPPQSWIDWALNAGYTEDIVYAKYKGFITQMILGSEEFLRKWYDRASDFNYVLKIDIDESTSDNWQSVKVLNAATFSLYKFTPHIYEGGRLVYIVYGGFFGTDDLGGPTN